jgi:FtsZ-interacting cell division protein ZipA
MIALPAATGFADVRVLIIVAILGLAAVLLVGWIGRLQRKSRRIEKTLDYSKMREWKDED